MATTAGRVGSRLVACALVLAAALAAGGPAPDIAARAVAALAQTSGTLRVAGLSAPVEVVRDRFGIPHVYAKSADDLFFAQGFVQAQDRLFQMELWRRGGQGRLAELLGPDVVERDRLVRLVGRYRGDLGREWESYGPGARRIAERFVAGVNACVASLGGRLPLEFALAGMKPERWSSADLLARAEAFSMSGNAVSEVTRARVAQALGLETALRLAPPDPRVPVALPEGLDLAAIDAKLAANLALLGAPVRFGGDEGSNNWVMSGQRTTTGKPLLANDPHRNLDHPSLRYLVHLVAPGWNVIGAVVPWFPGVAIGHNERVGWGLTIFRIDAQDLVVEETHPDDATRYRVGDGFSRMRVERDAIAVRGAPAVPVEHRFTRHGPVVYEDRARRLAVALRWTGGEPGTAGYLGALAFARASSAKEFQRALAHWRMPGENFVFADVDGNIGYQAAGLVPVRASGSGLLPVPGAADAHAWRGWLAPAELPHVENPARGAIATANHNVLPRGYPHAIGYEWVEPWRASRIESVLAQDHAFGVEDFRALQQDVLAGPAAELAPRMQATAVADAAAQRVRDLLVGWDHRLERDSAPAALFAVWQAKLEEEVLAHVRGDRVLDPALLRIGPRVLIDELRRLGAEGDAVLAASFERAFGELRAHLGEHPSRWRWGDLHTATFRHPLATDDAHRALFDRGPIRRPGYGHTVNNTRGADFRQEGGASFRMILDLADWDRSIATSAPGQSGQPGSPHFDDLVPGWDAGRYFPLAYSRAKVLELAESRLLLEPASR